MFPSNVATRRTKPAARRHRGTKPRDGVPRANYRALTHEVGSTSRDCRLATGRRGALVGPYRRHIMFSALRRESAPNGASMLRWSYCLALQDPDHGPSLQSSRSDGSWRTPTGNSQCAVTREGHATTDIPAAKA